MTSVIYLIKKNTKNFFFLNKNQEKKSKLKNKTGVARATPFGPMRLDEPPEGP
jgi:hypothetical protein